MSILPGITIHKRDDCCVGRFQGVEVRVGNTKIPYGWENVRITMNTFCDDFVTPDPASSLANFTCSPGPILGKYLSIQRPENLIGSGFLEFKYFELHVIQ